MFHSFRSAHWYVAIICYPGEVANPEWQSRSSRYEGSEASESPSPPPPNITSEAEAAEPATTDPAEAPPDLPLEEGTEKPVAKDGDAGEEPMDVDEDDEVVESNDTQPMETEQVGNRHAVHSSH